MINQPNLSLIVPLRREAHCLAKQFATQQATPHKGKQVYLNTLAVYAVNSYLKWLQIEADIHQGHSWLPNLRALFNVADLVLPGVGKLECRPILPGETACNLPLEVREDRIGYVAVQFGDRLDEVQLLGFIRAVDISIASEQILIADFQPLDTLLDCIPSKVVSEPMFAASKTSVNLNLWLQNTFEDGWQTIEAMLNAKAANLAFRDRNIEQFPEIDALDPSVGISAGKFIDLGMQLASHQVALIIKIAPSSEDELDVRLRVYPTGEQICLPAGLELIVLDEAGFTSPESKARARSHDNFIQLQFRGKSGERFSVILALGDVSITENFII